MSQDDQNQYANTTLDGLINQVEESEAELRDHVRAYSAVDRSIRLYQTPGNLLGWVTTVLDTASDSAKALGFPLKWMAKLPIGIFKTGFKAVADSLYKTADTLSGWKDQVGEYSYFWYGVDPDNPNRDKIVKSINHTLRVVSYSAEEANENADTSADALSDVKLTLRQADLALSILDGRPGVDADILSDLQARIQAKVTEKTSEVAEATDLPTILPEEFQAILDLIDEDALEAGDELREGLEKLESGFDSLSWLSDSAGWLIKQLGPVADLLDAVGWLFDIVYDNTVKPLLNTLGIDVNKIVDGVLDALNFLPSGPMGTKIELATRVASLMPGVDFSTAGQNARRAEEQSTQARDFIENFNHGDSSLILGTSDTSAIADIGGGAHAAAMLDLIGNVDTVYRPENSLQGTAAPEVFVEAAVVNFTMIGGAGADIFFNNYGDNTIIGGREFSSFELDKYQDIVVMEGERSEYSISLSKHYEQDLHSLNFAEDGFDDRLSYQGEIIFEITRSYYSHELGQDVQETDAISNVGVFLFADGTELSAWDLITEFYPRRTSDTEEPTGAEVTDAQREFISIVRHLGLTSRTGSFEILEGDQESNLIVGGLGDDLLNGRGGVDFLMGGLGNDTIVGGMDLALEDWRLYQDYAVYAGKLEDYAVTASTTDSGIHYLTVKDLTNGASLVDNEVFVHTDDGEDTVFNVGALIFSDHTISFEDALGGVEILTSDAPTTGTDGRDFVVSALGLETNFDGLGGNDQIFGSNASNTLVGGLGSDRISPGGGGQGIVNGDTSDGQSDLGDEDTLTFENWLNGGVVVDLGASLGERTGGGPAETVANTGFEHVEGSEGDDILLGDDQSIFNRPVPLAFQNLSGGAGRDLIRGMGGEDSILGGDDDDVLEGGGGANTLFGQSGNDTLVGGGSEFRRTQETFENGPGGWTTIDAGTVPVTEVDPETGNTYLTASDADYGFWSYLAPPSFSGDHAAAFGGVLRFDMRQTNVLDNQQGRLDEGDVSISGGGITIYQQFAENPGSDWTTYSLGLYAGDGWLVAGSGEAATAQEILQVLGDITQLRIRGEYRNGSDTTNLDNVVLGYPDDLVLGDDFRGGEGTDQLTYSPIDMLDVIDRGGEFADVPVLAPLGGASGAIEVSFDPSQIGAGQVRRFDAGVLIGVDQFQNIETLTAGQFNDTILGDLGAEGRRINVEGGAGNDLLIDGLGNLNFDGGLGDDTVRAQAFDEEDIIYDWWGLFFARRGLDDHEGGAGTDTYDLSTMINRGAIYDSNTGLLQADYRLTEDDPSMIMDLARISGFEVFIGTDFAEDFTLIGQDVHLRGGDDTAHVTGIAGRALNITTGDGNNSVTLVDPDGGTVQGGGGVDRFFLHRSMDRAGLEISAGANADYFEAQLNNDTLLGQDGDDWFSYLGGVGTFDGGADLDTLSFAQLDPALAPTGVMANLGSSTALAGGNSFGVFGFENVVGTNFSTAGGVGDNLTGSSGSNLMDGRAGNDTLLGLAGDDVLFGGLGDDSLSGGAGNDILFMSAGRNILDGGDDIDTANYGAAPTESLAVLEPSLARFGDATISTTSGTVTPVLLQEDFERGNVSFANGSVDTPIPELGKVLEFGESLEVDLSSLPDIRDFLTAAGGDAPETVYSISFDFHRIDFPVKRVFGENGQEYAENDNVWQDQMLRVLVNGQEVFASNFADDNAETQIYYDPPWEHDTREYTSHRVSFDFVVGENDPLVLDFDVPFDSAYLGPTGAIDNFRVTQQLADASENQQIHIDIENLVGGSGDDHITGDDGANVLVGEHGDDTIIGGGGNDTIFDGHGVDSVSAGDNDDVVVVGHSGTVINAREFYDGGAGNDTLDAGGFSSVALNTQTGVLVKTYLSENPVWADTQTSELRLFTASGTDVWLNPLDVRNSLDPAYAEDLQDLARDLNEIMGVDDPSLVIDFVDENARRTDDIAGFETYTLSQGDDAVALSDRQETVDGNLGVDLLDYSQSDAAVNVNLVVDPNTGQHQVSGGYAEGDAVSNFENVYGSSFDDTIMGDDDANFVNGLGGNDLLQLGAGDDTADGGSGTDTAVFSGNFTDYRFRSSGDISDNLTVTHWGNGADGEDTYRNVEYFQFADQTVHFDNLGDLLISAGSTSLEEGDSTTVSVRSLMYLEQDLELDIDFSGGYVQEVWGAYNAAPILTPASYGFAIDSNGRATFDFRQVVLEQGYGAADFEMYAAYQPTFEPTIQTELQLRGDKSANLQFEITNKSPLELDFTSNSPLQGDDYRLQIREGSEVSVTVDSNLNPYISNSIDLTLSSDSAYPFEFPTELTVSSHSINRFNLNAPNDEHYTRDGGNVLITVTGAGQTFDLPVHVSEATDPSWVIKTDKTTVLEGEYVTIWAERFAENQYMVDTDVGIGYPVHKFELVTSGPGGAAALGFGPGATESSRITLRAIDDVDYTGDFAAVLSHGHMFGDTLNSTGVAHLTIEDDEAPELLIYPFPVWTRDPDVGFRVYAPDVSDVADRDLVIRLNNSRPDLLEIPEEVTLLSGETQVWVDATVLNPDEFNYGAQDITITAFSDLLQPGELTVEHIDADPSELRLQINGLTDGVVSEAGSLSITVTRTDLRFDLEVDLAPRITQGGIGNDLTIADLFDIPESVFIPAGQKSITVDLPLVDDALAGRDMTVEVVATASGTIFYETAEFTIEDDDERQLSVSVSEDTIAENGGTTEITISHNVAPFGGAHVFLWPDIEDVLVTTGDNEFIYEHIASDETSITFSVAARDNGYITGDQSVLIGVDVSGFGRQIIDLTIIDDDAPELSLEIDLPEGWRLEESHNAAGFLTRNWLSDEEETVAFRTDVAGQFGQVGGSTLVTFAPGQYRAAIDFEAYKDELEDGNHEVNIWAEMLDGSNAGLVSEQSEVLLQDTWQLRLETDDHGILYEGDSRLYSLWRSDHELDQALTVDILGSVPGELVHPETVTFEAGQDTIEFEISGALNQDLTSRENVNLIASHAHYRDASSGVTIDNTEDIFADVQLSSDTVSEGETFTVTVIREDWHTEAISGIQLLSLTGSDWTYPAPIDFAEGQLQATIEMTAPDDDLVGARAPFEFFMTGAGTPSETHLLTLLDNDTARLAITPLNGDDGSDGVVTLVVDRNFDLENAVTVTLSVPDGSGASIPASVTIAAGERTAQVDMSVPTSLDGVARDDLAITVTAGATSHPDVSVLQAPMSFSDPDELVVQSVSLSASTAAEGDQIDVTITHNGQDLTQPVTGALTLHRFDVDDLGTFTIPAGQNSVTTTVTIPDDGRFEDQYNFHIGARFDDQDRVFAPIKIANITTPYLTVEFEKDTETEAPQGYSRTAYFEITRNEPTLYDPLTVYFDYDDSELDMFLSSYTFAANQTSARIYARTTFDDFVDGDQFAAMSITADGFVTGTDTILVTDIDLPSVFLVDEYLPKGDTTQITLRANFDVTQDTTITLALDDDTYLQLPDQVTFGQGETTKTIDVTLLEDFDWSWTWLTLTTSGPGLTTANTDFALTRPASTDLAAELNATRVNGHFWDEEMIGSAGDDLMRYSSGVDTLIGLGGTDYAMVNGDPTRIGLEISPDRMSLGLLNQNDELQDVMGQGIDVLLFANGARGTIEWTPVEGAEPGGYDGSGGGEDGEGGEYEDEGYGGSGDANWVDHTISLVTLTDEDGDLIRSIEVAPDAQTTTDFYENGHRKLVTVLDTGGSKGFESKVSAFDVNGIMTSRVVTYDDRRVQTISFENGRKSAAVLEDLGDLKGWSTREDLFTSTGDILSRSVVFDDGRLLEIDYATTYDQNGLIQQQVQNFSDGRTITKDYQAGKRTQVTIEDGNDGFDWNSVTTVFDNAGRTLSRTIQFDDGRQKIDGFQDDKIASTQWLDSDNAYKWSSKTLTHDQTGRVSQASTVFDDGNVLTVTHTYTTDEAGVLTQKSSIFSDGREAQVTYENGKRHSEIVEDLADVFVWETRQKTFDENGLSQLVRVLDDGVTQTTAFENGLRDTAVWIDVSNTRDWSTQQDSFGDDGALAQRVISFDDGRVETWDMVDGVLTLV